MYRCRMVDVLETHLLSVFTCFGHGYAQAAIIQYFTTRVFAVFKFMVKCTILQLECGTVGHDKLLHIKVYTSKC